jgi:hypothetical protein
MDWNRIGALASVGCLIVAIVGLAIEVTKPGAGPWLGQLLLGIAFLGVALFSAIRLWLQYRKTRELPFRLLSAECKWILDRYKRLAFDYPA